MNDKESFFEELHDLDAPDNSTADVEDVLNALRASRPSRRLSLLSQSSTRRVIHSSRSQIRLGRTVSAPATTGLPQAPLTDPLHEVQGCSAAPRSAVVEASFVQSSAVEHRQNKKSTAKMAPTVGKKRKRGKSLDLLPEAQQIFRGLRFFFVPNDDIAPSRKLRIKRALERGAIWIKEWDQGITHIIVDKSLTYSDILKFLKIVSIPSNMTLVNELYPAECIQYKAVVNPDQRPYHVQGFREKPAPQREASVETSSTKSLSLKPEKGRAKQPSETPTRTEPSEQNSLDGPITAETNIGGLPEAPVHQEPKLQDRIPDALDMAIEETLAVKDLPLDDEDDDNTTPLSRTVTNPSNSDNSEEEPQNTNPKKTDTSKSWQAKFSCMTKHTAAGSGDEQANPNARTIEILQKMLEYYDRTHDQWRTLAYRKAISALKDQRQRITTKEAALAIPNIGSRLAAKIEEIAFTDRLRRLDNTSLDDRDTALQLFTGIYGVGPTLASQWIDHGHRTLADLLSSASLTPNQRIGIDHIADFALRIPRQEVERHGHIVRTAIAKVDPTIEVTIGGSYRRGAASSGDVDFIITKPSASIETLRTLILGTVIPRLTASRYIRACLAAPSSSGSSGSKWHGCACLPGLSNPPRPWRRIDFLFVPHEELGAALIYFTGNDIFNRSIRLLAGKKGMRLNQRGLWRDVLRGKARERITQGSLVEGRSERRIFEILEVPWRPPNHRIC